MKSRCGVTGARLFVLVALAVFFSGCAHRNSYYTQEEQVTLRMIDICKDADYFHKYRDDWESAFKNISVKDPCEGLIPPSVQQQMDAIVATGVVELAGLAVDAVGSMLEKEADKHEAQFGKTIFIDKFWAESGETGECKPRYSGFELVRRASRKKAGAKEEAFKAVYAFAEDKSIPGVFWAAPLYLKTTRAKAKVSSFKHSITTGVEVGIDAVWWDARKNAYHNENIASFKPAEFKKYDIAPGAGKKPGKDDEPKKANTFTTSCKKEDKTCLKINAMATVNAFPAFPPKEGCVNPAKYWLKVLVTEQDASRAKKYLTSLSNAADKNRDKAVDFVKGEVEPEE